MAPTARRVRLSGWRPCARPLTGAGTPFDYPFPWPPTPPLQWDKVENKTSVLVYGAGGLVVLWLSSTIVGALNHVPLLPKLFELVGLGYSAWFTYR